MKEPTKYVNYEYLLKRLRRKYRQANVPRIYLVNGHYPVPHDGDYDWTIGFCNTLPEAEALRDLLARELKYVRQQTGKLYAAERNAYLFYHDARYGGPRPSDAIIERLGNNWSEAINAFRDKIDQVRLNMIDQDMPWPYSHIFRSRDSMDGPISYRIQEILKCPDLT